MRRIVGINNRRAFNARTIEESEITMSSTMIKNLALGTMVAVTSMAALAGGMPAQASSMFKFPPSVKAQLAKLSSKAEPVKMDCADLGGHWKGMCRYSGESDPYADEFTIVQETCLHLYRDGSDFTVGGKDNVSSTSSRGGGMQDVQSDWNTGRTGIVSQLTYIYRSFERKNTWFVSGREELELIGAKLVTRMKANLQGVEEGESWDSQFSIDCEYEKTN